MNIKRKCEHEEEKGGFVLQGWFSLMHTVGPVCCIICPEQQWRERVGDLWYFSDVNLEGV